MDWRAKVELFEQIRREYEFGIGSALPKPREKIERPRWKLRAAVDFVDAVLEADRKAPRKQRHTAHRPWKLLRDSHIPTA